jgi:phage repressor protein C with HTH and peptisase S24 domain
MATAGQRIRRLRKALGGETQAAFAARFGVDQSTVSKWESDRQTPEPKHWDIIASLEEPAEDESNVGAAARPLFTLVPLRGYVGAGAEVHILDRGSSLDAIEHIKAPRGFGPVEALQVRGDSMVPAYNDGDTIFLSEGHVPLPIQVPGEYVVELADGRVLLKNVHPAGNGRYTLLSHNGPPITGVEIVKAAKVRYVRKA